MGVLGNGPEQVQLPGHVIVYRDSSLTIKVGGVEKTIAENVYLKWIMEKAPHLGTIMRAYFPRDQKTMEPRGVFYIQFETKQEAYNIGNWIHGKKVTMGDYEVGTSLLSLLDVK